MPENSDDALIHAIRDAVIGRNAVLDGPYGPRRLTYADYTASGRSLDFVERFMRHRVMPFYANTHTESSGTGRTTTRLREEARAMVKEVAGGGEDDIVIFCGSGATGAINKLIDILNIRIPDDLDARYGLSRAIPPGQRPVVFVGPYEHHSNEIPWRETIADVIVIGENAEGGVDLPDLERALADHADRPLRIGSFSAASNVTGIVTDADVVTRLLHEHGALAFWDYAAAGPYLPIRMTPPNEGNDGNKGSTPAAKDAVFLSPHKFIGGPGTPGVLIVKRHLLRNRVPATPGGGTVAYVNPLEHDYIADPVHREEGGTPEILGSIRAGLVFRLKRDVGEAEIHRRESEFTRRALASWSANPNIRILGNLRAGRLPIISFMVRHGDLCLHHDFVVTLLNDLFGIQTRGGCSCAGPYGHRLLDIDLATSRTLESIVQQGYEGAKPGWTRVSFNYFIPEAEFAFIDRAVHWVAGEGWKLLPDYRFNPETGYWRHRDGAADPAVRLSDLRFPPNGTAADMAGRMASGPDPDACFDAAERIARDTAAKAAAWPPGHAEETATTPIDEVRWFLMPEDAAAELAGRTPPAANRSSICQRIPG